MTSCKGISLTRASIWSKLEIPGWLNISNWIFPMESVVADMIFLAARLGSSFSIIFPFSEESDLDIFFSGVVRLRMRIPSVWPINFIWSLVGAGTTKVSPNLLLKRIARSRVSSMCWNWSSPTGM